MNSKTGGVDRTGKRAIEARLRSKQAIELRLAGGTYRQIAAQLGYKGGPAGAYKAVVNALGELAAESAELADQLRQLEAERLDVMQLGLWQRARRGDVQAVDRVLKIMERRAKLFRLDPPEQKELSGPDGGPIEVEHARALLADRFASLAAGHDLTSTPEDPDDDLQH